MSPSLRTEPPGRVATNLIACLFALALAALVWPPEPAAWRRDVWIADVRAEQRRALGATTGTAALAHALATIRAHRSEELRRRVGPLEVEAIAREIPFLGVDPASGQVVPVDTAGHPADPAGPIGDREGPVSGG